MSRFASIHLPRRAVDARSARPDDDTAGFSRLGVIGDIHASDDRLEVLLDYLAATPVDRIVCVGDIVTGPGSPDRCVQLLEMRNVLTVRGNHDRWLLEGISVGKEGHMIEELESSTVEFMRRLPASAELVAADGTRVLLCHGLGDNDMNGINAGDYGYGLEANNDLQQLLRSGQPLLVVKGHRHQAAIWTVGTLTLIDAGSLLDEANGAGVIVDFTARTTTTLAIDGGGVSESVPVALALAR